MNWNNLPRHTTALLAMLMITWACTAQSPEKTDRRMDFEIYEPTSGLKVPEHPVIKARYPFVDVHTHHWNMPNDDLNALVADMDRINMQVMVNLSGRSGKSLQQSIQNIRANAAGRILVFANLNFNGIGSPGWSAATVAQLKADVAAGASGLKIFKNLGLSVRDVSGKRVPVDDPRLDPVWKACGELGIPVLIHSADPRQFWQPHDEHNERWLELKLRPGRKRSDTDPAPWEQIIAEQHRVFGKHPETTFINAHFGWHAGDLAKLAELMETYANMVVEFGAVIAELGRQPRFARQFFETYQDRILFGKDAWNPEEYYTYFRVLETADEYFPYYKKYHAFWRMYGMNLPDEILKKVYYKNALRIIPGMDASLFPAD